jgi:hypothetical protein
VSTPSDDLREAQEALWRALEERAAAHREARVPFSESQHGKWHKAYRQGRLIDSMNRAMEKRASSTKLNNTNLRAMAETLRHGLEIWEQILIRPHARWRPYVTYRARQGAEKSIAAARAVAGIDKEVMRPGKRDPARPLQGGAWELGKRG